MEQGSKKLIDGLADSTSDYSFQQYQVALEHLQEALQELLFKIVLCGLMWHFEEQLL